MLRVSFGDKPSATIATVPLRKTAEMSRDKYPEEADIIQRNTYMDDIIQSTDGRKQAIKLTQDIEEKYSNAFNHKVKYVENVTTSEKATCKHTACQVAIDNAKVKRNTARAVFEASYESISHALQSKEITNFALRDLQKQIEDQFQDCKTFNAELLELLPFETAESEMQWITKIQTYYYEIVEQIVVKYTNVEEQKQIKQESDATSPFLKLAKVKLPHFDGELHHYPQFKRDFDKQVMTQIRAMDTAYVLRSCLGKEPESLVKNIDNDVQEMWRRTPKL